ncbi:MAG: CHAT domain-containing protein [Cytophagaceae bacterium]|nr:CHAT domain-containing protein [Cytophagaceae bacterium]MDW8455459.1 CHAT domain-containing protein [Cytophagaceae bacterium]
MIRISLLYILCLFCGIAHIQAQDSANVKKQRAWVEKKLSMLDEKYRSGEYEEVTGLADSYLQKLDKKKKGNNTDRVYIYILKALSYYALLQFSYAEDEVRNALKIVSETTNEEERSLQYSRIANYYLETGFITMAEWYWKKADSLYKAGATTLQKNELDILKAKILSKQGFHEEALKIMDEQVEYRKQKASERNVDASDKIYYREKNDWIARKQKFAELSALQAYNLVHEEKFEEAEQTIKNSKLWIERNVGKNSKAYTDILASEAFMNAYRERYFAAASFYLKSYCKSPAKEYQYDKNLSLTYATKYYFASGDIVRSKNYLRRLQMFSFKHLGRRERFTLNYLYADACHWYYQGLLYEASKRIKSIYRTFDDMPKYHPQYLDVKQLELAIAERDNKIETAISLENELAEIKGTYIGRNTPEYHKSMLNQAVNEIKYGKRFKFAETIYKSSYDGFLKKTLYKYSKENMYYAQAYADLYAKLDQYDSAIAKAKDVTDISRKYYGPNSAEYLAALASYSEYCILAGKYKEGLDTLTKVTSLKNQIKKGKDEVLQKALLSLARLNKLIGEYDLSKSYTNEAYKLTKDAQYDVNILDEIDRLENLADLYVQNGNYSKASKIIDKSLTLLNEKFGNNSPKLIPIYFENARLNQITGNYKAMEQSILSSKSIIDSVYGPASLKMSECMLLLGDYYMEINDYKNANEAYKKADEIQQKKLGKKHLKRAETLLRLAQLYLKQGVLNSNNVDNLYKEALDIISSGIGSSNPLYMETLQRYSEYLISSGTKASLEQADKNLEQAEKYWAGKLGNSNKYIADIYMLRGTIQYQKDKYKEAETYFEKSRKIYADKFDENHQGYLRASGKLARAYYMQKQTERALEIMDEIIPKYLKYVKDIFPSLSFRQKSKTWAVLKEEFEFYTSIALTQEAAKSAKYTGKVYNNILSTKALLLSSNLKLLEKINSSNDSILISLYNEWTAQKEYLINVISLSKEQLAEQGIKISEIESGIEQLEKEMSKRSELFSKNESTKTITWQDVQAKLVQNEYAVEIVRFRYFNKTFTDSSLYAALILEKNTHDNPDYVIIKNGSSLEKKYLKYFRNTSRLMVKDELSYNAYWLPIKSKIKDGATVYLSCDGVYNQINIEMLANPNGGYALDQNQIILVTNTKDLMQIEETTRKKTKESKKELNSYVLCGSPVFYTNTNLKRKNVPDLPGAKQELQEIDNLLASSGKPILKFIEDKISEDTLKKIKNPKVLHVATHGYFKETPSTGVNEDDITTNPLLNSGLMLLGSGDIVDNEENSYVNQKDGILTAYEAMDLSLDNTDLVVLSACETGRGEVQLGEGVYGLQRSFLIAGAKAVIISLFKVNDDVTQKLMVSFYNKWLKTGNKQQAFVEAKKLIKDEYKEPIYWGAFIMIEGKPERNSMPALQATK